MKNKFKRRLAAFCAAVLSIMPMSGTALTKVSAAENLVAFPGAVGAGKYATGGRGGEVYHVTNLNDSGTGSFRDAVSKSGRIVVFDVSGTIELKSNILCQSNITIAGQTAPGGSGITLKNYKMGMSGDNIICRFISSRPGPYASTSSGNDAWGGAKGSNSIIDHCSMGWTTDEQWGLYSNNQYYTVQYSVLGPADSWGGHSKGLHGFGIMMGKGYLTFDHNLIIHNISRNFRGKVEGQQTADFTNNIIYDWGYQTAYGTIGHLNYVNNTLKAGNSTTGGYHWMYVDSGTKPENFKVYCAGNQMIMQDGSLNSITNDNWAGVTVKETIGITKDDLYSAAPFQTTLNGENVSTASTCESAADSYQHVISFAGNGIASDKRTAIDQQCAYETANGTGSCSGTSAYSEATDANKTNIDKYHIQCGVTYTYPSAVMTKEITDNDNDGMDDEWEELRGLNPNDPTDTNGDYCGQGYTNIEYYINDLTVNAFPEGVVTPSPETGSALEYTSAFEQREAENFDTQEGIIAEDTSDESGNQNIGYIENGDYALYKRLDFEDGAKSFTARLSGNAAGIELYLDNLNTPAAKISYSGTGSFGKWETVSFNIPTITGKHNLYIKFTGGEGYLVNMNWFQFNKEAIPVDGILAKNLLVNDTENGGDWKFAENAAAGSPVFGDRDFTFTALPEALSGAEQILTACDSKNYTDEILASAIPAKDITVYVAVDSRVENTPAFLNGWTKTDMTATSSNDVNFIIYQRNYLANQDEDIIFGSNGQAAYCVNYTVFLKELSVEQEPTETEPTETEPIETEPAETEPIETEPAETEPIETEPAETESIQQDATETVVLLGDADMSGKVDILDVITINRAILGKEKLTAEQLRNADIDSDNKPTAVDSLTVMKAIVGLVDLNK